MLQAIATARNGSVAKEIGLTPREIQVLVRVAQGKNNREIAALLCIKPPTVKKHMEHIFGKLGVTTRVAAVALVRGSDCPAHSLDEIGPLVRAVWGLTRREADVLTWVARGKSNAEISLILGVSPATVKKHLERIYGKLGVKSRAAAVVDLIGAAA